MSRASAIVAAACLALAGCSDGGSSATTTTVPGAVATGVPVVDQIDDAITALEAELGGPQEYFEINATARLINLFVALDGATQVQPWLYFDGDLTAEEPTAAQGGVLRAVDLDFDASAIFERLQVELPGATIESFYVHGDGQGGVQYGALLTTSQGGALDVQLGSDGQILSSATLN